jgi:ribosome maturation factor RimP
VGGAHSFGIRPVMKLDVKQRVADLIAGPLASAGFALAEVNVSQYKANVTLRVFVYGEHGVSIDDCAGLSRLIGDLIDGTDLFQNGYLLEVSSPGLDRPLTASQDYRYRVGETVKIEFVDRKREVVRAVIKAAGDRSVEFSDDNGTFTVELADIKKAQIVI